MKPDEVHSPNEAHSVRHEPFGGKPIRKIREHGSYSPGLDARNRGRALVGRKLIRTRALPEEINIETLGRFHAPENLIDQRARHKCAADETLEVAAAILHSIMRQAQSIYGCEQEGFRIACRRWRNCT
jgi:hypothetical protein